MSLSQAEFNELMQLGMVYFYRTQDASYVTHNTISTFQQANIALTRLCNRVDALQLGVLHDFYFFNRPSVKLHQKIKDFVEASRKVLHISEVTPHVGQKFVSAKEFEILLSKCINESFKANHSFTEPQAFSAFTHYSNVTGPAIVGGAVLIVACAIAMGALNPALPIGVLLFGAMLLASGYLGCGIGKTVSEIMFSSPVDDDSFVSQTQERAGNWINEREERLHDPMLPQDKFNESDTVPAWLP